MSHAPCFVGIDGAKAQRDMALRPSGERWAVPNATSGVATRVDRLQRLHPTLLVLEAPGGLERLVPSALATARLPVVVVHPRQARDFARATGPWAKTEALDARALAPCADVMRPTPRPWPDAQTQERRALLGRRPHLVVMRTAEQHRLAGTRGRLRTDIEAQITWRNARLAMLDNALETRLRASPLWRENDALLQRAPGMGPVCARTWVLALPEIGDAHAPADCGVGWRGAAPWRQGDPPRSAHDLGRPRSCAHCLGDGPPRGHALPPAEHSL